MRQFIIAIVPAVIVGGLYELFLGHRHDYAGHYLAGYGATLAAASLWFRILPPQRYAKSSLNSILPGCVICILLGVLTEATIFRIAKFDEIDFCNQSLGAVFASVAASTLSGCGKPSEAEIDIGLIIGIAFVGVGGCFAFA